MKFLKFLYPLGIIAIPICILNMVLKFMQKSDVISSALDQSLIVACSFIIALFLLLSAFAFPIILRSFNEKQYIITLSYLSIAVLFLPLFLYPWVLKMGPTLLITAIGSIISIFICYSSKAQPIRKFLRISIMIQTTLLIPLYSLKYSHLYSLYIVFESLTTLVNLIVDVLLIRIVLRVGLKNEKYCRIP